MNEIIEKGYPRVSGRAPVMASYGILPHHGFIILQSSIKSVLYLNAVLSMQVDLSTKSYWLDLT